MSLQSRSVSGSQLSPGNFLQPAAPIASHSEGMMQQNSSSALSAALFHRVSPRDPFTLSAPPTTTVATLPGTGGLFLSPSVNSHSAFVPARVGANKAEAPVLKPPKPPEKPLMPYMRYSRRMWEKVRLSNPDSKLWDIGKIIGQMWRELPDPSRQVYVDEYESEKQEYDKALKAYHNSPSYQAYLLSKNRSRGSEKTTNSGASASESGVFIQPVEEDEGDAGQFSAKQTSASRFYRNHRLMKEIFGEVQVPDARNVITSQRLGVLKKQVNSLTLHQNKLEEELKQLEGKFEAKKRKMSESSAQFSSTLKKICSHKIEPFEELVEKSKTNLLNAYEQYKQQERKQREALETQMEESQATNQNASSIPPTAESNQDTAANSDQKGENDKNENMTEVTSENEQKEKPESDERAEPSAGVAQASSDSGTPATEDPKPAEDASEPSTAEEQQQGELRTTTGERDDNDASLSSLPPDDSSENSQEA